MRYRKLDANGDYVTGHGSADFYYNQPEAVAQAVGTRLMLFEGEWFLDITEGTPWGGFPLNPVVVQRGQILGAHTQLTRDVAIRTRTIATQGVTNLASYGSQYDPNSRRFSVQVTVDTLYGRANLSARIPNVATTASPPISDWDGGGSIWDYGASLWDRRIVNAQ